MIINTNGRNPSTGFLPCFLVIACQGQQPRALVTFLRLFRHYHIIIFQFYPHSGNFSHFCCYHHINPYMGNLIGEDNEMDYSELYVKRIRQLCKERGFTINKLATMSNVAQSTLDHIVQGTTRLQDDRRIICRNHIHTIDDAGTMQGSVKQSAFIIHISLLTLKIFRGQ